MYNQSYLVILRGRHVKCFRWRNRVAKSATPPTRFGGVTRGQKSIGGHGLMTNKRVTPPQRHTDAFFRRPSIHRVRWLAAGKDSVSQATALAQGLGGGFDVASSTS